MGNSIRNVLDQKSLLISQRCARQSFWRAECLYTTSAAELALAINIINFIIVYQLGGN